MVQREGPKILKFSTNSVLLTRCENTLKEIGLALQMDNAYNLKRLIDRLPYDTRKRWCSVADNISEVQRREIEFHDVVEFVYRQAGIRRCIRQKCTK